MDKPNIENIQSRTEMGKKAKESFTPIIPWEDYSDLEQRTLEGISKCGISKCDIYKRDASKKD